MERASKTIEAAQSAHADKNAEQLAEWGSCVSGVDEGDGWFKVGELYLPTELNGVSVLTPIDNA